MFNLISEDQPHFRKSTSFPAINLTFEGTLIKAFYHTLKEI